MGTMRKFIVLVLILAGCATSGRRQVDFSNYDKPLTEQVIDQIKTRVAARLGQGKNPDDRQQAFRLLSASLQKGVGFDLLETDKDLDPIRNSPEFQRLVDAARAIRATMTVPPPKTGV